jgi:hypothetical protein
MVEALALAYAKLGPAPSITMMPMGSLTVPRLVSGNAD